MEKLELKHLASYLPYELKYANTKNDKINTIRSISTEINMVDFGWGDAMELHEVKPILRPLSDLTKEIEVDGEKFIAGVMWVDPDRKEWDRMICEEYNAFPKLPNHPKWIRVVHDELGEIISVNPHNAGHLPYNIFQKLFEWHFDVFGLIEKGLAIDINTIEK